MANITEKRLLVVSPQSFTANGEKSGKLTITDTTKFVVGHIVLIRSSTQQPIQLKIKRISSATEMYVGPINQPIHVRSDISGFLVADGAAIEAEEQPRPSVPEQEIERNTYDEEPIVARRVSLVDTLGKHYTTQNPVPVRLSDGSVNIGTVNAELETQLSHQDNYPNLGDVHDSVRIGDGVEELAINPDGSINVVAATGGASNPLIQNISLLLADTEYTITIPSGTKKFAIRSRTGLPKMQLSYIAGQSSSNFITIYPGNIYTENDLLLQASINVYIQSSKASQIIEVVSWS